MACTGGGSEGRRAGPAENQTLASITFQNLFRMYKKLSGMTGTADTEAFEFQSIYGLEVVVIRPTARPSARTARTRCSSTARASSTRCWPTSKSAPSAASRCWWAPPRSKPRKCCPSTCARPGVQHEVLNAKQHDREATIVANAGRPAAVTIATNMAGRGTDIVLGGSLEAEIHELGEDATDAQKAAVKAEWQKRHEAVKAAGGLHIVGTERHESRRIDTSCVAVRAGQGDPGSSRSLPVAGRQPDAHLRLRLGAEGHAHDGHEEDDVIEDRLVSRQIEKAQRKVEAHNFDIRKNLLDFDDVNNDQRRPTSTGIRDDVIFDVVARFVPPNSIDEQWDLRGLEATLESDFGLQMSLTDLVKDHEELDAEAIAAKVQERVNQHFAEEGSRRGRRDHCARWRST
ncbi:unnamed protein product [Cylicocyclus nassatus]|uniref:SecA family profile domain-containing protein n=1 Tax=Cylicocyclus nassatus TaxID=53992 RepID=A0AA36HH71_CYLNA|nr:unnamed protein product [Cylicocyclus nassatus]